MTTQVIAKNIADAVQILLAARLDKDVINLPSIFTPLIHAQRHIEDELKAVFAE